MKKVFYSFTCTAVLASGVWADFTRAEFGAGAWMHTPKGSASYTKSGANGSYTSSQKDNTESYLWAIIKHPLPVIPNLRVEYASIEDDGSASGKFKDFDIGSVTTSLSYDMKQYDVIPYYNILDNTAWATLDLGVDLKIIDYSYSAAPLAPFIGYSESSTFVVPLLYARTRAEIPSTDIAFEADIKYITTGDSTVYDARVKADYTLDIFPVVQPSLEVGYRVQKFDIDDSSVDAKLDIDFSGIYAGMMFRF